MTIFGTAPAAGEMMKVKLLSSMTGHVPGTNGNKVYAYDSGAIIPLPKAEALRYIEKGLAVEFKEAK